MTTELLGPNDDLLTLEEQKKFEKALVTLNSRIRSNPRKTKMIRVDFYKETESGLDSPAIREKITDELQKKGWLNVKGQNGSGNTLYILTFERPS
jgi:hypothetical protein